MIRQKHWAEYRALQIAARMCQALGAERTVHLGRVIGTLAYFLVPIRKKTALINLRRAFPEKSEAERRRILRRTYANFGQTFFEFLRHPVITAEELKRRIVFHNDHLLHEAAQAGKGALLLTGHFGNWEIMAAAIAAKGYPIVAIAKRQRNRLTDRLINEYRRAHRIESVPLGMGVRHFLRALRSNSFVALLADQDAHREGVFVDFFGQPSATAPGVAQLALRTRAPIIFGACFIEPRGRYTVQLDRIPADDLDHLPQMILRPHGTGYIARKRPPRNAPMAGFQADAAACAPA